MSSTRRPAEMESWGATSASMCAWALAFYLDGWLEAGDDHAALAYRNARIAWRLALHG